MKTRIGAGPLLVLLCPVLTACNWVDSTGVQGVASRTEVFLDDTPVGSAVILDEKSEARIVTSRGAATFDEQTYSWSAAPLEQGALAACASQGGFNANLAASSLDRACTDPSNCSVSFERVATTDGVSEFSLTAPELKASVGLRYGLIVQDSTGTIDAREYDFCFVAINEAPDANDDTFVIREGIREVFSINSTNLLSNDTDDTDVSNTEFRILTQPTVDPQFASVFALGDDGAFTYESSLTGILSDQIDTFEYALSDGVFTSTARVTLRIVANNQAPEQLDDIPELSAAAGEPFAENLSLYFADPEEGDLSFSFAVGGGLPVGSRLSLSSNGVLSGTPILNDVGSYQLQLLISDGGREIETLLTLEIVELSNAVANTAPVYVEDTVFDQIIFLGTPIRSVVPEFEDADDDELTFSIFGTGVLPDGVTIDSDTGLVSGRPLARTWVRDLRIEAIDPFGATAVSDSFFIRVR
ncbi:MAG: hypothetical protein ACI9XK_000311 [Granulosicoccus sp.]